MGDITAAGEAEFLDADADADGEVEVRGWAVDDAAAGVVEEEG